MDGIVQLHENKVFRILQQLRAVAGHDVGDGDVGNRENGAVLVNNADAATVNGGAPTHALELDFFRDGIEHFDENDAELASFKLIDVCDHGGLGNAPWRSLDKKRMAGVFL